MSESNQAVEIHNNLLSLEQALIADTPKMPELLRTIHKQLKADPDVVTVLSDEECAILVKGLKKVTATSIAVTARKAPTKKALSKLTVDDL